MKTIDIIIIIIFSIILLLFILRILFINLLSKINTLLFKINDSEETYIAKNKDKCLLLTDMIQIIENDMKIKSKKFSEVKKLKSSSNFTFEDDKLLNKAHEEILKIIDDNKENKNIKKLKELIKKYEEIDLYTISLRTYYNKYTLVYNNLIKKFPYIIVSKLKKYKLKVLFDGEELSGEDDNIIEV